ncbi:cob(I)yrinic acid a,c-diamide adenosyltransferase [Bacillus cereus]|nr:cob(I)yrinic acid a,c-diamide adenosyltransferase [Bacillus cereus]
MKLYTKTGDKGTTSVIGGRVDKDDIRVEAYGTIDEANSHIGYAMTKVQGKAFRDIYNELENIQHELFDCGGDLAIVEQKIPYKVTIEMVESLERKIDLYIEEATPLERFILPGGSEAAATIHIARTVVRRAERSIVSLQKEVKIKEDGLKYVNRLSEYEFERDRVINDRFQVKEVEYNRRALDNRDNKEKEV